MYEINLFGKLKEFKHEEIFVLKPEKKISVNTLKKLIVDYLSVRNRKLENEIEKYIGISALSDNDRIFSENEIVNPGNIFVLPPVSGG